MALNQPPPDSISKMAFAPTISSLAGGQDLLAVASWDNNVRIYSVRNDGFSEPKAMYSHDKPVLDLTWHSVSTLQIYEEEGWGLIVGWEQIVFGRMRWGC